MMTVERSTAALRREIRAVVKDADAPTAMAALWAVATTVSIATYGQAVTAEALRDLADEIERDLFEQVRGRMQ